MHNANTTAVFPAFQVMSFFFLLLHFETLRNEREDLRLEKS